MILVHGSVTAKESSFDEILALSQEHVVRSRLEPGCIAHAVHRDTENSLRLVFVEQWESQSALWDHFKVPASRVFGKALQALAQEAPAIVMYEATPLQIPGKG